MTKLNGPNLVDPVPPEGYPEGKEFRYPKLIINILAVIIFILAAPILGIITLKMRNMGPPSFAFDFIDILIIFATNFGIIIIHELLHGVSWRAFGYTVEYGFKLRLLAAYAAAFGQFQKRNHVILVALTPIVAITLILFPFLLISNRTITTIVFAAIVFNLAGAAGDFYLTFYLLRSPAKTLMYDVTAERMLVFPPLSEIKGGAK